MPPGRKEDEEAISQWSQREADIRSQEMEQERLQQEHEELNPSRRPLHKIFILVKLITGLSALNMGISQLIGMAVSIVGPLQYVLRLYVVLLCLLVVLNELEWSKYTRDSLLLRIWVTRGLLYAFIGILGLEEFSVSEVKDESAAGNESSLAYIMVVAWLMIGCGCLYTIMGLLCLQLAEDKLREDYKQRKARARQREGSTTLSTDDGAS